MTSKAGNVFIQDREQNESFESPCDDRLDNNNDNEDNYPDHNVNDEEIDQLLDDDNQSKEEAVLKFKVNQLQKICNSLTLTNKKLIDRLTVLEEQKQENTRKQEEFFVDEYSQLNSEFTQVQALIHEYKNQLENFQKSALSDMKTKQQRILKYKAEVKDLKDKNQQLKTQKQDIQKLNKQLQTRNQGLIIQIQNLQKQNSKLEQKLSTKPQYNFTHGYRFDNHQIQYDMPFQIQKQYQSLIDKLVKQLEYEKNMRKKMSEEIKRMSHDLMQSQKQIMNKNKRLYEMEMKLIRSSKTTTDSSVNHSKFRSEDFRPTSNSRQQNSQRTSNKADKQEQKFNFKSFPLLSVINGQLDEYISNAQRKIIGVKVIDFYQRKVQRQDFSNVMPQNLLISNFNHKKADLISIRKIGTSAYEDGQKTQQSLIWNLAFILDNLFGQIQGAEQFDQILSLTGQVLEKQIENSKQILQAMKQTLVN